MVLDVAELNNDEAYISSGFYGTVYRENEFGGVDSVMLKTLSLIMLMCLINNFLIKQILKFALFVLIKVIFPFSSRFELISNSFLSSLSISVIAVVLGDILPKF